MENVRFCWFAPTSGEFAHVNSEEPTELPSIDYIIKVAQEAENAGFNDILVPIDSKCMDPIVSSAYILENTERINTLIAYRPGITSPQILATMLSTLNNNNKGRVRLNMVQGNLNEALRQGYDVGDTKQLPLRMKSFSKSLRELLYAQGKHDYSDSFYTYKGATVNPKFETRPPAMFIGGGQFAMELAGEHYDYYLTFGDSVEKISKYVKSAKEYAKNHFNRDIKVGIGINVVVRNTTEEAWSACQELLSQATEESILDAKSYYIKNKAIGGRSYVELEQDDFILESNLWAGLAQVRYGPVATIFGSYEEVANKIVDYYDVGVEYFSLTGYPFIKEVENVGKVIKIVKSKLTVHC